MYLEASWAPVDEVDVSLGLDVRDGGVDVFWHHVAAVEQAAGDVLAVPRVARDELVRVVKARRRDVRDAQLLVVRLLSTHDWRVVRHGEVDPGVGNQVGLELCQVHVQGTIKPANTRTQEPVNLRREEPSNLQNRDLSNVQTQEPS